MISEINVVTPDENILAEFINYCETYQRIDEKNKKTNKNFTRRTRAFIIMTY